MERTTNRIACKRSHMKRLATLALAYDEAFGNKGYDELIEARLLKQETRSMNWTEDEWNEITLYSHMYAKWLKQRLKESSE